MAAVSVKRSIGIATFVDPIKLKTKFTFFLIVLNTLWLGIIFTIKLDSDSKYYPVTCERFDQWTDEHI